MRNKLYVNHDWLEKYCQETGKEAPVTTQEFEDMLIYWRDNDMNGNGDPSDEIPMAGTLATDGGDFTVYLLNAFQAIISMKRVSSLRKPLFRIIASCRVW